MAPKPGSKWTFCLGTTMTPLMAPLMTTMTPLMTPLMTTTAPLKNDENIDNSRQKPLKTMKISIFLVKKPTRTVGTGYHQGTHRVPPPHYPGTPHPPTTRHEVYHTRSRGQSWVHQAPFGFNIGAISHARWVSVVPQWCHTVVSLAVRVKNSHFGPEKRATFRKMMKNWEITHFPGNNTFSGK